MDQPFFTQPKLYEQIEKKVPHLELYVNKLLQEGVVTREEVNEVEVRVWGEMTKSLENSKNPQALDREYLTAQWNDMKTPAELAQDLLPAKPTAITQDVVNAVAGKLGVPGEPFQVHKNLKRILQKRRQSL
ncbi:2-oxoglutarate dehydrogenase, mitochondrial [Penicillium subrubescens]|jgi:2-oxoglutarate dehydrogenase E1 component|uniref:2-oxoglutarate dehydrogenase, mitochondrial n=1 Tax=Penicillium subrubescens TaxID=1316194 RepID=A0A1Q5UQJ8_9EURO|nr:2-oxoglutarate dehydrogenase, mitochondrial [Penicillium subrubescens]